MENIKVPTPPNNNRFPLLYKHLSPLLYLNNTIPSNSKILKRLNANADHNIGLIDSIIEMKKEQLTVLDEYKKAIIYEYVTGKKEVRHESRVPC